MRLLAIDPGPVESAYVIIDGSDCHVLERAKVPNVDLIDLGRAGIEADHAAIEMIASYGMPVGADVFGTCVWIGRFAEVLAWSGTEVELITRNPVKLHHCHNSRAKDSNIIQALVDRFALGQPNRGKGTNALPGWFHGFTGDIWQAYALAVYAADQQQTLGGDS